MNLQSLSFCLTLFFLPGFCGTASTDYFKGNAVIIKSIDPLIKITPDALPQLAETDSYVVARNEEVNFQLAVWNKNSINDFSVVFADSATKGISDIVVQKTGYVSITTPAANIDKKVISSTGLYPDPLFKTTDRSIRLDSNSVNSFWISFHVDNNMRPGLYSFHIICRGSVAGNEKLQYEKTIRLNVTAPVVNQNNYPWFSNWLFVDVPALGPTVKKLKYLNNNADVKPFTPDYWEKICSVASFMGNAGQNVVLISPQRLAQYSYKGDSLMIDFSRFDSTVNCFLQGGVIGRIEGWHIASRKGGWISDYKTDYIKKDEKGNAMFANGEPGDADVQAFYKVYFHALIEHLKSKNWFQYYYQHIADEPLDLNADSYMAILKMVNQIAPELKTIDAIQTTKVADGLTIPVPQFDYFAAHLDYFESLISKGKEVWLYTAWLPQKSYANRFIEQQAIMHRLLFWVLAKYNLKGALSWGFNFWENADPYKGLGKKSGLASYPVMPAGDGWLVYPYDNQLATSIRLRTMKDGMDDYALLMSLKQKDPKKAEDIVDKVILNYDSYVTDIEQFRKIRLELLNALNSN